MSVQVNEIGALDASKMTVYTWDKEGRMVKDDGSGGKLVVPAATTPSGPLPAIVPPKAGIDQGVNVPAAVTVKTAGGYVSVPGSAREDVEAFVGRGGEPEKRPVPTWAWVAGGAAAVLVTYMLLRPTRGIHRSAPATAGLGRLQRGRKRPPKRR